MSNISSINLEIAHVYINENYNREHFESSWVAKNYINSNLSKQITVSILIDDYNPTEKILKIGKYIDNVENNGLLVDFVASEASLVEYYDLVLANIIQNKIRKREESYLTRNCKVPCSSLVATWYLIRLGKIKIDESRVFKYKLRNDKHFVSNTILNILPNRFRDVEKKALDLIASTSFGVESRDIQHIFF